MQAITYVITGDPMPLARARYGKNKIWDSQKQQKFAFGLQLNSQHEGRPLYSGPLHLDVTFFMPIPQYKSTKSTSMIGRPHIFVPDLSNLIKFIEDASTGILFGDDCLIYSICADKIYDINSRTEFKVTELRNSNGKKESKG